MLNKEEVQHIAKLARLGLTPAEVKKFQKELSSILDYIEKLKEIDIGGIEPTSHSVKVENIIRNDKAEEKSSEIRKKLIEMAPDKKDGYLKVKSIF